MEYVDRALIGNATHLSDKDFSRYPAIAEVITGSGMQTGGFQRLAEWLPVRHPCLRRSTIFQNTKGSITSSLSSFIDSFFLYHDNMLRKQTGNAPRTDLTSGYNPGGVIAEGW